MEEEAEVIWMTGTHRCGEVGTGEEVDLVPKPSEATCYKTSQQRQDNNY